VSLALLLAVLVSGVAVATVLVPTKVGVAVLLGTVAVKLKGPLVAPGARLPTVKVRISPLLRVTVPITAVAVAVAVALLVKLTVPVTIEPPGALAGRSMIVVTSETKTPNTAVAGAGLEPKPVVKEPAGIVFATPGEELDVTTTETEQLALAGMTVPIGSERLLPPPAAIGAPAAQVVAAKGGEALINPGWYWSVNTELKVADTKRLVLVKVMTNKDVPPAGIEAGLNVLVTLGRLGFTASTSVAAHTPAIQRGEAFVLVTLGGGVMEAVLVIEV
jgi:hypothetical protein